MTYSPFFPDGLTSPDRPSVKRALDLILGTVLLIAALPVFALIALAIRIESRGPVFFRQLRTGLNGQPFEIFKFRTMDLVDCNAPFRQARDGDPRVTRLGYFLRRTSLDELPQLLNVIRGDMSLVGPRPHVPELDAWAMPEVDGYRDRWRVKPGITGWAQVCGLRGVTPTAESMRARVEADVWYARNASVALDLRILLLTVRAVMGQRNAI